MDTEWIDKLDRGEALVLTFVGGTTPSECLPRLHVSAKPSHDATAQSYPLLLFSFSFLTCHLQGNAIC